MTEPDHSQPPSDHAHDDHGGIGKYLAVFAVLCVLTGASFFTYSDIWPFKETPAVGWAFMMAVSCTKAMLVILFFMHLLWEANWKYVLTIPASFMSLFLLVMLVPDVGLRMRHATRERLLHTAVPVAEEQHEIGEQHDPHQAETVHEHQGEPETNHE